MTTPIQGNQYFTANRQSLVSASDVLTSQRIVGLPRMLEVSGTFQPRAVGDNTASVTTFPGCSGTVYCVRDSNNVNVQLPTGAIVNYVILSADVALTTAYTQMGSSTDNGPPGFMLGLSATTGASGTSVKLLGSLPTNGTAVSAQYGTWTGVNNAFGFAATGYVATTNTYLSAFSYGTGAVVYTAGTVRARVLYTENPIV